VGTLLNKTLGKEWFKAVAADYIETKNRKETAIKFGISLSSVDIALKKAKVPPELRAGKNGQSTRYLRAVAYAKELLEKGASQEAVVADTGLSRSKVRQLRKDMGLPIRQMPEQSKAVRDLSHEDFLAIVRAAGSVSEAAYQLGASRQAVWRRLDHLIPHLSAEQAEAFLKMKRKSKVLNATA